MTSSPKRLLDAVRNVLARFLAAALVSSGLVSAFPTTEMATLPLDPPDAIINRLTFELSAVGTVQADLGIFGTRNVNINDSDTDTSSVSGSLLCEFGLEIDPATFNAEVQSISFGESQVFVDDDLAFKLDLGSILIFDIGDVNVAAQNVVVTPTSPSGAGSVTGSSFPLSEHALRLYGGSITGDATGLAADYIDPIDVDLAETPVEGPLGTGNGSVSISAPSRVGSMVSYDVVVTVPVDFAALILEDPVDVTISSDGTVRASGTLTVEVPLDRIEVIGVSAGSPLTNDVTITWNSQGAASTFRVLSSSNLSIPRSSWTIEDSSVPNSGAMTSFVDTGALESSERKFYVIEEN